MSSNSYDITVIGGGPVGMFATFYAGLRDAKVQLIESLPQLGGQVQAMFPKKILTDIGGCAGLSGQALIQRLRQQMHLVNPKVSLGHPVTDVHAIPGGYQVVTDRTQTKTRAVIIATGAGAFAPRKLLAKNAKSFTGHQLFYRVADLNRFRDRTVLVAGGGNSALDNALLLDRVAKQVYLLHRRNRFRGLEHTVDLVKKSGIKIVIPYLIRELAPTAGHQVLVTVKKMRTRDTFKRLKVDDLVVNYGFIADHHSLAKWQISPKENHFRVQAGPRMKTNLPNVYTVGDVATYPGKDTLIATGFGEVPLAVNSIMRSLYPHRRLPLHSTSLPN